MARPRTPPDNAFRVVGLDDEMHVIVLNAEVQDPKARARRCGERVLHGGKYAIRSQTPKRVHGAQRDVHRVRRPVFRATAVRHAGTVAWCRLSSRTGSPSTPGRRRWKLQLGAMARHELDWANIAS